MKNKVLHLSVLVLSCALFLCVFSACFLLGGNNGNNNGGGNSNNKDTETYDLNSPDIVVSTSGGMCTYSGEPLTPDIRVYKNDYGFLTTIKYGEEHEYLEVSYSNNVNVGDATFTVTAKSGQTKYRGSATGTFSIGDVYMTAKTHDELVDMLSDINVRRISVSNIIELTETDNLTIRENVSITFEQDFKNYGKLKIDGKAYFRTWFNNYGTITGAGMFYMYGAQYYNRDGAVFNFIGKIVFNNTRFYDSGTLDFSKAQINGDAKFYTTDLAQLPNADGLDLHVRTALTSATVQLAEDELPYTGSPLTPTVIQDSGSTRRFNYDYSDNIAVGTAKMAVSPVNYDDENFYGSVELTFQIVRGVFKIKIYGASDNLIPFFTALTNPDYCEIDIDATSRGFGAVFTIPEDKTVVFTGSTYAFYRECKITNDGVLIFNSNSNFGANTEIINNGTLRIEATNFSMDKDAIVTNNGTIVTTGVVTFNNEFTNDGSASVEDCYFEQTLTNNGTFVIQEGKSVFIAQDIVGTQKIQNKGTVYVNSDQLAVKFVGDGDVVVRLNASSESLQVLLEEPVREYTGGNIFSKFLFKVNGEETEVPTASYQSSFTYQGASEPVQFAPVNAGVGAYTIVFKNTSTQFYGSISVNLQILSIEVTATTLSQAFGYLNNTNYYKIILNSSSGLNSSNFTIPDYQELVISADTVLENQSQITVDGALTVYGEILNKYSLSYSGTIVVRDGAVENYGTIYFNGATPEGVQNKGEGTIVNKVSFAEAEVEYCPITYISDHMSWTAKKDNFTVVINGVTLLSRDFNITSPRHDSGTYDVTLYALASSREYYGSIEKEVTVNQLDAEFSDFESVYDALLSVNSDGCGNYGTITVTSNISVNLKLKSVNKQKYVSMTVPKGTTLDLRGIQLTSEYDWPFTGTEFNVIVKGTMLVTSRAYTMINYRCEDGGVIEYHLSTQNFAGIGDIFTGRYGVNKIVLTSDIVLSSNMTLTARYDMTLDLAGHSITGLELTVYAADCTVTVCDSVGGARIEKLQVQTTELSVLYLSNFYADTYRRVSTLNKGQIIITDFTYGIFFA